MGHQLATNTMAVLAGGEVPTSQWSRETGGEVHILHVHGPKLDKVTCIFDFMGEHCPEALVWTDSIKASALKHCGIEHHQAQAMMSILAAAHTADRGALYRETEVVYTKLLRKANALLKGGRKISQSS